MKRSRLIGIVATTFLVCPLLASAADPIPDIKGKWVGKSYPIVAGKGGHWPKSGGNFGKPAFGDKDIVLEFTGQDGRRFWGVTKLSGNGETTTEPFIGYLTGKDNRTVVMADTDGYFNGQLSDDNTFEYCYMHAGGPSKSTVVACLEVKRTR